MTASIQMSAKDIIKDRVNDKGVWTNLSFLHRCEYSASTQTLYGKIHGFGIFLLQTARKNSEDNRDHSCIFNKRQLSIYHGKDLMQTAELEKTSEPFALAFEKGNFASLKACFFEFALHSTKLLDNEWVLV